MRANGDFKTGALNHSATLPAIEGQLAAPRVYFINRVRTLRWFLCGFGGIFFKDALGFSDGLQRQLLISRLVSLR